MFLIFGTIRGRKHKDDLELEDSNSGNMRIESSNLVTVKEARGSEYPAVTQTQHIFKESVHISSLHT